MKYEFRGKTVKDAILKGLKKLGLKNAEDVSITILDEGSRGLFKTSDGLRPAVVMMEPKSGANADTAANAESTVPTIPKETAKP